MKKEEDVDQHDVNIVAAAATTKGSASWPWPYVAGAAKEITTIRDAMEGEGEMTV